MLNIKEDLYNGVIVDITTIAESIKDFTKNLKELIKNAQDSGKNLIWIDLTTKQSKHIAISLELGFIFHNCEAERTTLVYKLKPNAYIPVSPSHTIGVGVVVVNSKDELLMVRDRVHTSRSIYKIPGGMLELSDTFIDTAIREVQEETGIDVKPDKLASILHTYPYTFNKANLYIVFKATPQTTKINVADTNEINFALWLPLKEFFEHKEISNFQKYLVKQALDNKGLSLLEDATKLYNKKKLTEIFS